MVVLYFFARSQALSCFPRQRSTRDGAPAVSLADSVSSLAAEIQTFFTLDAASARKSTGKRTSMPRSPRLPWTSSGQTARAVTLQSSGSSSWQLTSMDRSATRGTPPSSRYSARTAALVRRVVLSPSRLTETAPQETSSARMDSATTPISSTSRTVWRRVTVSQKSVSDSGDAS